MQQSDLPSVDVAARWRDVDGQRVRDGYDVHVNGTALPAPAAACEVVEGDLGPLVVLTIPARRVTVGGRPPVTTPSGRAARVWGGSGGDPRG